MEKRRYAIDAASFGLLAQDYIDRHAPGWKFRWNTPPKERGEGVLYGSTHAKTKTITLNKTAYVKEPKEAWDTLRHEVAHAQLDIQSQNAPGQNSIYLEKLRMNPPYGPKHGRQWARHYLRQVFPNRASRHQI